MKYLILNENNVIVYITETYPNISNGMIDVGPYKFIQSGLRVVEVEHSPEGIKCQDYSYDEESGEFYITGEPHLSVNNFYTKPEVDQKLDEVLVVVDEKIDDIQLDNGLIDSLDCGEI